MQKFWIEKISMRQDVEHDVRRDADHLGGLHLPEILTGKQIKNTTFLCFIRIRFFNYLDPFQTLKSMDQGLTSH